MWWGNDDRFLPCNCPGLGVVFLLRFVSEGGEREHLPGCFARTNRLLVSDQRLHFGPPPTIRRRALVSIMGSSRSGIDRILIGSSEMRGKHVQTMHLRTSDQNIARC